MNQAVRNNELKSSSELEQAKREVAEAEAALSHRLHEATALGEARVQQAISAARPILIGAAVVGGVVWVVSMLRRPRRGVGRSAPSERGVVAEVVRAAALSLASVTARRVAERFLALPDPNQSISAGRGDSPHRATHRR